MADSTQNTKRRVEEILWSEGLLTEDQIRETLAEQRRANLFINEALVRLGYVSEEQIAGAISKRCSLPSLRAEQYEVSKDVLDVFPETMLREYQFIPLDRIGDVLIILGATLLDRDVLREIQRLSGCQIYQYVGTWTDIRQAIDRLYRKKEGEGEDLTSLGKLLLSEGESVETPATEPAPPTAPPRMQEPAAPEAGTAASAKPRKGLLNLFRKK